MDDSWSGEDTGRPPVTVMSGMGQEYVVTDKGEKFIPGSVRKDGTVRKELKIKEGFVPLEEQARFTTKLAEARRLQVSNTQYPAGYSVPTNAPAQPTQPQSPSAGLRGISAQEATKATSDKNKKAKSLRKRLREIEAIQAAVKNGEKVAKDKLKKIEQRPQLELELALLDSPTM